MSEPSFIVRRLGNPDADTFRFIRLESLQQNPNDFGSTFEKESNEPSASFVERFDRNTVFGGFVRERLMGIVGFSPLEGPKRSHIGVSAVGTGQISQASVYFSYTFIFCSV